VRKRDQRALGAAADGACEVCQRCRTCAARQITLSTPQIAVPALQLVSSRSICRCVRLACRDGDLAAEVEQVVLHRD